VKDEDDEEVNVAAMQLRMLRRKNMENAAVEVAVKAVELLVQTKPVFVLCRTTRGTAHYVVAKSSFWEITNRLTDLVRAGTPNKLVICVLTREVDESSKDFPSSVRYARDNGWLLRLSQLNRPVAYEMMQQRLGTDKVDPELMNFIYILTFGRPKFILESIWELLREEHIMVDPMTKEVRLITPLDEIHVAEWSYTAMVGDCLCEIESLDPQESAIIKMATVFTGPFSIADLASSSKSPWAGAFFLDSLRLFRACLSLVSRNMLDKHEGDRKELLFDVHKETPLFVLTNEIVRRVGSTMLLEAQKMAVKRAALMQRRLYIDLPSKMAEKRRRDKELHVAYWNLTDLGGTQGREEYENGDGGYDYDG
jgi:hypothetical protein